MHSPQLDISQNIPYAVIFGENGSHAAFRRGDAPGYQLGKPQIRCGVQIVPAPYRVGDENEMLTENIA